MPGEPVQVEELLRAPRLSGDYGDIQTALNDWLGESAQLKYPLQGDLLSPFLLQDLDGDGRQDAAVLYTTAKSSNVCIAILQRDSTDAWQVRQNVEGLADDAIEAFMQGSLLIADALNCDCDHSTGGCCGGSDGACGSGCGGCCH